MKMTMVTGENKDELLIIIEKFLFRNNNLSFNIHKEDNAQKVLEYLIKRTKESPDLCLKLADLIFSCTNQILVKNNPRFGEKTRALATQLAAELFCLCRKHEEETIIFFIGLFLSQIFDILKVINDDPYWDGDEPKSSIYIEGKERLAQFASAMGGQYLLERQKVMFESNQIADKWQRRYAAVVAYSTIASYCSKELDPVVQPVLNAVKDPHIRVSWAALNAIEEFSKNFCPEFQCQYYHQVLPALTEALIDFHKSSIQVKASSAMLYFNQNCTSDRLTPYLNEIVKKLLRCLRRGRQKLKEGALTVLASLAASMEDLQGYYKTVMPYMKVIMMKAATESNYVLLAKSVESIIMVGVAVGKENFSEDIQMVVEKLFSLHHQLETKNPIKIQVLELQAWGKTFKCFGQDFQPYMDVVIPHLLKSSELALNAKNSGSEESSFERNLALEETAKACKVLHICADELKEGFDLWIDEVAQTLVPLITYEFHEEIRKNSILAMPAIFKSSKAAMEKGCADEYQESPFKKLCSDIVLALVEALDKEPLEEIQVRILESLDQCIGISEPTLDTEDINWFLPAIMKILMVKSKVENEKTEKIHSIAGDCLTTFIKAYKAALPQFFDLLFSYMAYIWDKDKKAEERRTALHIFTIVAEQCREQALKYCESYLPSLFDACYDENPEVQLIVAQGIGVSAEFGGSIFKQYIREALEGLKAIIGDPKTLQKDCLPTHDAAVSVLGKICLFHHEMPDGVEGVEVFGEWLSHLPITHDVDEAKVAHDQLCSVVERLKGEFLHEDNSHLSKIFAVFAQILVTDDDSLATEETIDRVIEHLKYFKSNLPSDKWASIFSSL